MHRTVVLAALLGMALAPAVPAQENPEKSPLSPAAQTRHKELTEATTAARRKFAAEQREKAKAAREAGQPIPAARMAAPLGEFVAQAQAAAKEYAGTEDAVPFLIFAATNAGDDTAAADAALKTLLDSHLGSSQLVRFVQMIPRFSGGDPVKARERLDLVIQKATSDEMKASAYFARGNLDIEDAPAGSETYLGARSDLVKAAELTKDSRLASRARGAINGREKLAVGMAAPEIEGEDLDGVAFKLSDYRGKVVMLDFWGDW